MRPELLSFQVDLTGPIGLDKTRHHPKNLVLNILNMDDQIVLGRINHHPI
jgi:hypothetical protein